ncbi:hypothetical protein B0H13DRAFT_2394210 [Mycena leptocephala]|nr:hypothetical protein B0H13DRAFT_2394210 [Mycena leptocephala]
MKPILSHDCQLSRSKEEAVAVHAQPLIALSTVTLKDSNGSAVDIEESWITDKPTSVENVDLIAASLSFLVSFSLLSTPLQTTQGYIVSVSLSNVDIAPLSPDNTLFSYDANAVHRLVKSRAMEYYPHPPLPPSRCAMLSRPCSLLHLPPPFTLLLVLTSTPYLHSASLGTLPSIFSPLASPRLLQPRRNTTPSRSSPTSCTRSSTSTLPATGMGMSAPPAVPAAAATPADYVGREYEHSLSVHPGKENERERDRGRMPGSGEGEGDGEHEREPEHACGIRAVEVAPSVILQHHPGTAYEKREEMGMDVDADIDIEGEVDGEERPHVCAYWSEASGPPPLATSSVSFPPSSSPPQRPRLTSTLHASSFTPRFHTPTSASFPACLSASTSTMRMTASPKRLAGPEVPLPSHEASPEARVR